MKRLGGVWPAVVSFENLLLAFHKARRGKGGSPDVARFTVKVLSLASLSLWERAGVRERTRATFIVRGGVAPCALA